MRGLWALMYVISLGALHAICEAQEQFNASMIEHVTWSPTEDRLALVASCGEPERAWVWLVELQADQTETRLLGEGGWPAGPPV